MISVKVDSSKLQAALAQFAQAGKKDIKTVMRSQAGATVGNVIALTPPAGGTGQAMNATGGVSLSARKRGESVIAIDIERIFPTTDAREGEVRGWISAGKKVRAFGSSRKILVRDFAFTLARMRTVHRYARNRRDGRPRVFGGDMAAFTRPKLLRQFIREQQKKVGLLSAGWLSAASQLGTASRFTPAWISRHGRQPGGTQIRDTPVGLKIRAYNDQGWFPVEMGRRVQYALDYRERQLLKAVEKVLAYRARQAERRQTRG